MKWIWGIYALACPPSVGKQKTSLVTLFLIYMKKKTKCCFKFRGIYFLACSIVEELQLLYDLKNGFQKDEIQILWDIYDQTQTAISII